MTANVQTIGLGLIERTVREHERITGVAGLWDGIKPFAEDAVKEMLPSAVNIHPVFTLAWKLVNSINDAKRKQLEASNGYIDITNTNGK